MTNELLVAVPGHSEPLRFTDTIRIGRAETNAIVLTDDIVSGEHVELRKIGHDWELVDLESTNGTYIDGERVTSAHLGAATLVRLGPGGPELRLTIDGLAKRPRTRAVESVDIAARYLS